jgi:mannose-6-phosphate isomerase-like protein (cupin superfamily)
MSQVKVIRDAEKDWQEAPADWPGRAAAGEPRVIYKMLMPRAAGLPNLQRSRYEPHHFEPPHSHAEDEVLYLLQGELAFGDQMLGLGDALFVPRNTRYSLRAGAAGAEFVRVGLPT